MRKVLLPLIAAITLLLFLPGCANHHPAIIIPANPSGGNNAGFSNASLNGTYVFTVHGFNFSTAARFAITGNFIADGSGNITGGVSDTVDDTGRRTLNEAITGTFTVNQDGRGQAILNGSSGKVILRFVLESPASGKLFEIGTTSHNVRIDAVGTIDLQTGPVATPSGAYIVRLDGEDAFLNTFGSVGRIVFTSGNFNGLVDENDGGAFSSNQSATGSISSFSSGRGTMTLSASGFLHHFVVYFVSPTKLELIATDTNFVIQGNAEFQSSFSVSTIDFASTAPEQVFALAGFDTHGSRAEVGRATLAVNGFLINSIEDIQNETNSSPFLGVLLSGSTFLVGTNGRWTASLTNGIGAPSPNLVGWQISPQKSVVLTTDSTIVETGNLRAQTLGLNTASVSGNFAEALSGFEAIFGANLELTANLLFDGLGAMDGTLDSQDDATGLNLDAATAGTYSIDPVLGRSTGGNIDGSGGGSVIPAGGLSVVYYAVDPTRIYFIPTRVGSIYLGTLTAQTP